MRQIKGIIGEVADCVHKGGPGDGTGTGDDPKKKKPKKPAQRDTPPVKQHSPKKHTGH